MFNHTSLESGILYKKLFFIQDIDIIELCGFRLKYCVQHSIFNEIKISLVPRW